MLILFFILDFLTGFLMGGGERKKREVLPLAK
jgi:hypothetical protein